jgi:hypothetical protein
MTAFGGIAFANPVPPPVIITAPKHHPSFWMKYGRFMVGIAVVWLIVDELQHKDSKHKEPNISK